MATILRCPRNYRAILSPETNSKLLAGKAATLKYLKANTAILAPEVFAYRFCLKYSRETKFPEHNKSKPQ